MSDIAPLRGYDLISPSRIARTARAVLPKLLSSADAAERIVEWARKPPGLVDKSSALPGVTIVTPPDPIPSHRAEELRQAARRQVGDGLCDLMTGAGSVAEVVESLRGDYPDAHYAVSQLRAAAESVWAIWYGDGVRLIPERVVDLLESAATDLRKAVETDRHANALSRARPRKMSGQALAEEAAESSTPPPPPPPPVPHWNKTSRQLCFCGDVLTDYKRLASAQYIVLDAFEIQGWPEAIPTPKGNYSAKDAIEALNDRLITARLKFGLGHDDGGKKVIRWWLAAV